jgi:hypothetical protein
MGRAPRNDRLALTWYDSAMGKVPDKSPFGTRVDDVVHSQSLGDVRAQAEDLVVWGSPRAQAFARFTRLRHLFCTLTSDKMRLSRLGLSNELQTLWLTRHGSPPCTPGVILDEGVALPKLRRLSLTEMTLTTKRFAAFVEKSDLSALTSLDLRGNGVGSDLELGAFPKLSCVLLWKTSAGVRALRELNELRLLDLRTADGTDKAGVVALAGAHPKLEVLGISLSEASALPALGSLRLRELFLCAPRRAVSERTLAGIEKLTSIERLLIQGDIGFTVDDILRIATLPKLHTLTIADPPWLDDRVFDALRGAVGLQRLSWLSWEHQHLVSDAAVNRLRDATGARIRAEHAGLTLGGCGPDLAGDRLWWKPSPRERARGGPSSVTIK